LAISTYIHAEESLAISTAPADVVISTAPYNAQTAKRILKIGVEGNQTVHTRYILSKIKTRKNDPYDPVRLQEDQADVFDLGNFENVTVDVTDVPGGVIVTFKVVEKAVVQKINFIGNKEITPGKLHADLKLKEDYPFDQVKLNADVDKILSLYKDEGFNAAKVEPSVKKNADNKATVNFIITEGPRVSVDKVEIQGVTAFPLKTVLKQMKTRPNKVFKQDVLDKDVEKIIQFYKNHGYANVKITDLKSTVDEKKLRVALALTLQEGPFLRFGPTTFTGNAVLPLATLSKAIKYKTGEMFSQDKLDATEFALKDAYGSQGFIRLDLKTKLSTDVSTGTADVEFQISEGDVVYVDHIEIVGLTRTKEYVIRREIKLKEGEPFNTVMTRKSVEKISNLGFVDNVNVDLREPVSPTKADVIFDVADGKPGRFSLGGGESTADGLFGNVGYKTVNFLGRGEVAQVNYSYAERANSVDVGWSEPWFLGKTMALGVTAYDKYRIEPLGDNLYAYDARDVGFTVALAPRFSDIYTFSIGYSFDDQLRYNVAVDTPTRQAVLSPECANDPNCDSFHADYSVFTEKFIRDTRDYYFDPKHGSYSGLVLNEGAPVPDNAVEFFKPILDESVFIPVADPFVLSLHGQWAYIQPLGGASITDIQTQLFRVGGSDSVRGYSNGGVGVSGASGNPGAQIATVYNAECKFPIILDKYGRSFLQGVFFFDVGGDWDNFQEMKLRLGDGPFDLKSSAGFGIRLKNRNIPINLGLGFPLNRAPGDPYEQFFFSIGSTF
jgi:outer membrane protein insertion porin family